MMNNRTVRLLMGLVFGAAGGMSFAITIFPYATEWFAPDTSFDFSIVLGWVVPMIGLWAVAGVVAGWYAHMVIGGLAIGSAGAVGGALLGTAVAPLGSSLMLIGTLAGLVYGGLGGLLIGYAFGSLVEE